MEEKTLVTHIEAWNKSRYKVYINQEFAFVLYKGELRSCGVKEGEEISRENKECILKEILPKRAKLRSMNLLKNREYTEYQLKEKLRQGLYPEEVIEEALRYVKAFHYIDDGRYARNYILYYSDTRSRRRIEQDLLRKGIGRELIRQAYEEAASEEKLTDERVLIEKFLEKRHYKKELADFQEKQKTGASLYRKGFSMDSIQDVLGC